MSKRIVCALLTLILLVGLIPVSAIPAFAAETGMAGKVTNTDEVNIRKAPGVENDLVTTLKRGTKVTVYETTEKDNAVWGRIDQGWVYMFYVQLDKPVYKPGSNPNPNEKVIATGTVNSNINLNVRNGAGLDYDLLTSLPRGTRLSIYEKKTVNGVQWGRIDAKNWVCLMYVTQDNTIVLPETDKPEDGKPETSVPMEGKKARVVNCNPGVNIRNGAGVKHALLGIAPVNSEITYFEEATVNGVRWVRTEKGWICTQYLADLSPILPGGGSEGSGNGSTATSATGVVISKVNLNLREGAGINYKAINSLKPGTKINIYEQMLRDGMSWGRTDGGWVCLAYVRIESTGSTGTGAMGTVVRCHNAVNVRSGPSTGYALIGTISVNSRVEILEQTNYNGKMWGRVPQGWVSMDYIALDSEMPVPPTPEGNTPNNKPNNPNQPATPDESMVSYYIGCIVDLSSGLKIRSSATSDTDNIVGELKNGAIVQLKGLKQVGSKLWGKVENGWIDLTYVKYNTDAIVRADELAARKVPTSYADKTGVVKKDQTVTITGLALENGSKVWGKVAVGWIELSGVEIGGKKGDPVNTNPEVSFNGYGSNLVGAVTHVQAIKTAAPKHNLSAVNKRMILALKADMEDPLKTWAKIEVDGTAGWIAVSDLTVKMPALVKTEIADVHKEAKASSTIVKSLNKNAQVEVTDLRVDGGKAWGKISGGWTLMDNLLIDGKLDIHVNKNPEAPLKATLKANKDLTGRIDAFGTAEAVATLPAGNFEINALKADDTKDDTFWVRTVISGVSQWILLDSNITVDLKAMVTAPNATLYDTYKAKKNPAVVVNMYDPLTITGLAAAGDVAWGKTPGGWVQMSMVEIGGKAPVPTNKNTEYAVKISGTVNNDNTPAYAEAHAGTTQLKSLAASDVLDIYAVKADADDASKLWASTMVHGVPCWVMLEKLHLSANAIVRPESIQRYAAPGTSSKLAGKAVHNETVRIEDLAIAENKVWGKDGLTNTWITMENVEVGGAPTAWPNNNPELAMKFKVTTSVDVDYYVTPSTMSITEGAAPAGVYNVVALKSENGAAITWAKVLDSFGNTSWINLTKAGVNVQATAGEKIHGLYEKPDGGSKKLADIAVGASITLTEIEVWGVDVWGKTTIGTETGWVYLPYLVF